jgi:hypothetical protein
VRFSAAMGPSSIGGEIGEKIDPIEAMSDRPS